MMLPLMTALALAGADMPAEPAVAPDDETLWEIGENIMLAQVCETFGYEVNPQGHDAWITQQRDAVIAAQPGLTAEAADAAIDRNARTQLMWMFRVYWQDSMFVREVTTGDSAQMTFVNLYRKKCKRWARTPEMAGIVVAPERRVGASDVVRSMRAQMRTIRFDP
jgi:cell wall-associated NlpC family hydrolase